jgi:PilZ domain
MTRFPPPPPGAERRVHTRHDVLVSVEVAHEDTVAIASLVNVSHGGAFLELSDSEMTIGVRVRVHLASGDHELSQDAKVVRVTTGEHAGFAVAWIDPGAAIAAVVDQLTGA